MHFFLENAARVPRRTRAIPRRGFSLAELLVVVAILAVLATLGLSALGTLRASAARRSFSADLHGTLSVARSRALVRQRTQVVFLAARATSQGTFGFFHLEDATARPALFAATQLATATADLDPLAPAALPGPIRLALLDSGTVDKNPFLASANAWAGAPLPYPWTSLVAAPTDPVSTVAGCSFCSGGRGSIAFLPSGRAIFSDGNLRGGLVVVRGDSARPQDLTGLAVSPSGFFQEVVR